jgi:hypothetical protein
VRLVLIDQEGGNPYQSGLSHSEHCSVANALRFLATHDEAQP